MPPNMDLAFNSVVAAVHNGELTEKRINESVYRVLRLKYQRGLVANPYVKTANVASVVGTAAHLKTAQNITDHSTTLIKNDGTLPLAKNSGKSVLVTGWGVHTVDQLASDLDARGVNADGFWTGSPTQATIDQAVAQAQTHDLTVVTSMTAWNDATQQHLIKALIATGKPVVVAAVRDPYDIAYYPEAKNYLATYSYTDVALESLTRTLFGEVNPSGKLPVMIPVANTQDQVLYPFGFGLSYGG